MGCYGDENPVRQSYVEANIAKFAPELANTQYGEEIWTLYEHGSLHPDVVLTGRFERKLAPVDLESVMREIDDARAAEAARLLRLQEME